MTVIASDDQEALLAERRTLLDKLFAGTITKAEQARRAWISWQLDNIDERVRQEALRKMGYQ